MTQQAPTVLRTLLGIAVCLAVGAVPAFTPTASADDRSLVKESESEPYVMILLDVTGSMNRVPEDPQGFAPMYQDDPASKMYQAKDAIFQLLASEKAEGVHFGFATFPNQDNLRVTDKSCNGQCISNTDSSFDNSCTGWEPNYPTANNNDDDIWIGGCPTEYTLKFPTEDNPNDPSYPAVMDYGDVIPMDWDSPADRLANYESDNRVRIQRRLAPNLNLDPAANPDFGVADYFEDSTNSCQNLHELRDPAAIPLVARGNTPLARSLRDFNEWYGQWQPLAEENDPKLGCKQVHTILITDGLDTCESSSGTFPNRPRDTEPPEAAGEVHADGGPQVWAVGYSISGNGKTVINNIATQGDTNACEAINCSALGEEEVCPCGEDDDRAFFPSTQDQLVAALGTILDTVRGEARSFAAAAVPQGQANAADTIYLASFLPFKKLPLWPGRLDAYLRPLPVKEVTVALPNGDTETRTVPDPDVECEGNAADTACRLWDAGEQMLAQGASDDQIETGEYNVGDGDAQRRVVYSIDPPGLGYEPGEPNNSQQVPEARRDFLPTTLVEAEAEAVMRLMGCEDPVTPFSNTAVCDATDADNLAAMHEVAGWVHQTKQYEVPGSPGVFQDYLLGEIFHSDPVVVGSPEAFRYYAEDLFSDGRPTKALLSEGFDTACGVTDEHPQENPGFVCFFEKHRYRRKVTLVGSNDGQLHAFDAGVFDGDLDTTTGVVTGEFTNGTGRELFSFIPRTAMRMLTDQAGGAIERYGVDGRIQASEVYIDPSHSGTPTEGDREWRTVAIGGLREGGRGYYALDITQPDTLGAGNIPSPGPGSFGNEGLGYVPSCIDGGTGCGTLPYASVLWEFEDLCEAPFSPDPDNPEMIPCDDDENGLVDLTDGWSRPNIGIVEVCEDPFVDCGPGGDDLARKFVAVFGGGFDSDEPIGRGNFIYIVDVETGQPIYKREVNAAVASEPAAVDTDQDGLLDTIYVGTVAGTLYKVDLTGRPDLEDVLGIGLRVTDVEWDPFPFFQDPGNRPIFYPPSVIFVSEVGEYAIAFGTGYREDLWARRNETARFYVVLDRLVDTSGETAVIRPYERTDALGASPALPLGPGDLSMVNPESTTATGDNLLTSPPTNSLPGWWMELQMEERIIAPPFALSGLLVFLTFQPDEVITGGGRTCANVGQGRSFTVLSTSGDPLIDGRSKYTIIDGLPTSPYTESGSIKNPVPTSGETEEGVPPELEPVLNALKRLFPRECRFANYTVNVKTRRADTGIDFIAPVPVCIVQKNWKGN